MKEWLEQKNLISPILIILLIFSAVLVSCRPHGILSSRQMREVIVDLHKADAVFQVSGISRGHEEERMMYYASVMNEHGITQSQFDSSLVWYTAHPQLFNKIYPKVIAQLGREIAAFDAIHGEEAIPKPIRFQPALTPEQLDSILWITQHGYPSFWNTMPSVKNLEYQFFP